MAKFGVGIRHVASYGEPLPWHQTQAEFGPHPSRRFTYFRGAFVTDEDEFRFEIQQPQRCKDFHPVPGTRSESYFVTGRLWQRVGGTVGYHVTGVVAVKARADVQEQFRVGPRTEDYVALETANGVGGATFWAYGAGISAPVIDVEGEDVDTPPRPRSATRETPRHRV